MPVDPKVIDKDFNEIENLLNRLKLEWDKYFGGGSKTPPWQLQKVIENRLNAYRDTSELSYYQKFRLNTISGKFTSMKERFEKLLRQKEEGVTATGKYITQQPATPSPTANPVSNIEKEVATKQADYSKLYEEYVQARKKCGESVSQLNYDNFSQTIEKQKKQIQEKLKGRDIEFYVAIEDGKAKLKARPK